MALWVVSTVTIWSVATQCGFGRQVTSATRRSFGWTPTLHLKLFRSVVVIGQRITAPNSERFKASVETMRQGRTLLFTSHDDDFVRDFATRVVVLAEGRVLEEGEPRQVLNRPKHEATRQLLQVEPAKRRARR